MKIVLLAAALLGSQVFASDCENALTASYTQVVVRALDQQKISIAQVTQLAESELPLDIFSFETRSSSNSGFKTFFSTMSVNPVVIAKWPEIRQELSALLKARGIRTDVINEASEATRALILHEPIARLTGQAHEIVDWTVTKDGRILALGYNSISLWVQDITKDKPEQVWKVDFKIMHPAFARDRNGDTVVRNARPAERGPLDRWIHFSKKLLVVDTYSLKDGSITSAKNFLPLIASVERFVGSEHDLDIVSFEQGWTFALLKKAPAQLGENTPMTLVNSFPGRSGRPFLLMKSARGAYHLYNFAQFDGENWKILNHKAIEFNSNDLRPNFRALQLRDGSIAAATFCEVKCEFKPGLVDFSPSVDKTDFFRLPASGSFVVGAELFQVQDGRVFLATASYGGRDEQELIMDVFEPAKGVWPVFTHNFGKSYSDGISMKLFERGGHLYFAGYSTNSFKLFVDLKSDPIYEINFGQAIRFSKVVIDAADNVYLIEQTQDGKFGTFSLYERAPL